MVLENLILFVNYTKILQTEYLNDSPFIWWVYIQVDKHIIVYL